MNPFQFLSTNYQYCENNKITKTYYGNSISSGNMSVKSAGFYILLIDIAIYINWYLKWMNYFLLFALMILINQLLTLFLKQVIYLNLNI